MAPHTTPRPSFERTLTQASDDSNPVTEILRASNVAKSYWLGKREIQVLRGVDLSVEVGEMVALLGASGAGKSTLLHVLGLLDPPTEGEVLFEGKPVHSLPARTRAKLRHRAIGFVFQFYHLIPELTALQNVLLGQMMFRGPLDYLRGRTGIRARALALLTEVGLEQRLDHRPSELSGGEKQRVAIARALMGSPRLLLCDEPTGNLDSENGKALLRLLDHLNQAGMTIVLVTHDATVASAARRRIRVLDGRIVDHRGIRAAT
jgi:lipoprotein-releasing system ATP-binding protein